MPLFAGRLTRPLRHNGIPYKWRGSASRIICSTIGIAPTMMNMIGIARSGGDRSRGVWQFNLMDGAMNDQVKTFGEVATGLARNPLGIIALFIVLVYGFASLVTVFTGGLTAAERMPLIYFLIGFPILVLAAFTWLVSKHPRQLFGPGDFRDEDNYVKMQLSAVASLAVAANKVGPSSEAQVQELVEVVRRTHPSMSTSRDGWRNHVLWVDDRPNNNTNERRAFEAVGLRFTLAESTKEALGELAKQQFADCDRGRDPA
jgi:hypothetical protein